MASLGIIGGTGLTSMEGLTITRREMVKTPYGSPSGPLIYGELDGHALVFLARHGNRHSIPPHRINYCANIWALQSVGVERVVAVAAVGGIAAECETGKLVIPDQVIDYTYDRAHTFFDGKPHEVKHIDFNNPYNADVRAALISAGASAGLPMVSEGVYGVTQGPRLETAAAIRRMEHDGCTIVGMTSMPEASLAMEMDLAYACCAVVVNPAAGKSDNPFEPEALQRAVKNGMDTARSLVGAALPTLA